MRFNLSTILLFSSINFFGQIESRNKVTSYSLDYGYGQTAAANFNFPEVDAFQSVIFSVGRSYHDKASWAKEISIRKTGIALSYSNFGNNRALGYAISALPYLELRVLRKHTNDLNLQVGLGASYFNKRFDAQENVYNKAISTKFTWAYRTMLYYDFYSKKTFDLKLGLGYFHNSNGHVRLPNQGLNSFLVSISSQYNVVKPIRDTTSTISYESKKYYFETRFGLGQRVLSLNDNDVKETYTFAASFGKNYKNVFRYGIGMTYRFYEDYYDYIKNDGALVTELYPELRDKPIWNASNVALFVSGELLLGHFGVEMNFGVNVHKPFYKVDWKINEGDFKDGEYQLGELTSYYKIKKTISSRLGLKYYVFNLQKSLVHNFYVAAHINANLGQADFSELSFGYVYSFK